MILLAATSLSGCFQSTGDFGRRKPNVLQDKILPAIGEHATWARDQDPSKLLKTDAEVEYRLAAWDYVIPTRQPRTGPALGDTALPDMSSSLNAELIMADIAPDRLTKGTQDWWYYEGMEFFRLLPEQPRSEWPQNYYKALRTLETRSHETRYRRLMADMQMDILRLPRFLALGRQVFAEDSVRAGASQKLSTIERELPKSKIQQLPADATDFERDVDKFARKVEERATEKPLAYRAMLRSEENKEIMCRVQSRYHERISAYRYALQHLVVESPSPLAIEGEGILVQLEQHGSAFPPCRLGSRDGWSALGTVAPTTGRKPVYKDRDPAMDKGKIVK